MRSHLVPLVVERINLLIVCPFMRRIKCHGDWTPVGVDSILQNPVVHWHHPIAYTIVKSEEDQLRDLTSC